MRNFFRSIHLILTLRCEHSGRLVSQSLDRRLSPSERLAVRGHALMCRSCRRYRRQLLLLRDAARRAAAAVGPAPVAEAALSPRARRRIALALAEAEPTREDSRPDPCA